MNTTSRILGEAQLKVRPPTELELTDPQNAYYYAADVIECRFPKGEAAIAKSPYWAYYYARYVIKGRFPEGEAAIAKDTQRSKEYLKLFPEAKMDWVLNGLLDWLDL